MPAPPPQLVAEFTVELALDSGDPRAQIEAARKAAAGSGLAREAGPETTELVGDRAEVLYAFLAGVEASLDAGARNLRVTLAVPTESRHG